jgi:hypothetical protein
MAKAIVPATTRRREIGNMELILLVALAEMYLTPAQAAVNAVEL